MLRRCSSAVLLLLLLASGAHSQSILDKIKERGEDILGGKVRDKLDQVVGIESELKQRAMTREEEAQAAQARQLFAAPLPAGSVYDPRNQVEAKKLVRDYQSALQAVKGRQTLTDAELLRLSRSMLPLLRFLAAQEEAVNTLTVFPGESRTVTLQGYCMDRHAPAPRQGERLQLVPSEELIDPEGRELYAALMAYSARNPAKRYLVQNLVWGMRHADEQTPFIRQLSAEQQSILNQAQPGGAGQWQSYVQRQQVRGAKNRAKRELYGRLLSRIERETGRPLPPPSASGYNVTDTQSALLALANLQPEGDMAPDSEFSLLAPNVAARTLAGGITPVTLEIANRSCEPFVFEGANYSGQSTRFTQRVALGGVLTGGVPSDPQAAEYIRVELLSAGMTAVTPQIERSLAAGTLSTAAGRVLGGRLLTIPNPWSIGAGAAILTIIYMIDRAGSQPALTNADGESCEPSEEDRCREMKRLCREKCSEELPTRNYSGDPFFICMRECLISVGCEPLRD